MCSDGELNPQLFGVQDNTPTNSTTQARASCSLCRDFLFILPHSLLQSKQLSPGLTHTVSACCHSRVIQAHGPDNSRMPRSQQQSSQVSHSPQGQACRRPEQTPPLPLHTEGLPVSRGPWMCAFNIHLLLPP
ncbi:hypothetical protein HJG60_009375 [Phyllostomus discolor]|uniref:Uncharacterized protein n=1 Tax=Phyllostomus discolor TaxID=89673 RepID=A0A834D8U1_9CHIR|nr:hypothetical protein HJG60_009375 [Phyllostomus discolor]